MAMRLSGLMSGMDTESVIQQLVEAKSAKVKTAKKAQTKLSWKQDAWKELNTKLKNLQSKFLSNMRFSDAYTKKITKVSNESAVSVITGENAMLGTQQLEVEELAKTAYMTGGKVELDGEGELSALTKLGDLKVGSGLTDGKLTINGKEFTFNSESTISDVLTALKGEGLNANFDAKQGRFYISAKESGKAGEFTLDGNVADMLKIGVEVKDGKNVAKSLEASYIEGTDARIKLNGVEYTNSSNTFEINGLTITAQAKTTDPVTVTTQQDTDGIYGMIKNFLKEYNTIINEIDKLYNADSTRGYEPLTDDEKEAMSESEIEKYEQKIKDSILRRDENLSTVGSALREVMSSGVEVDGRKMYLFDFGIDTLGYFNAADNEKNAYHIDGDPDDVDTCNNEDKLKSLISSDPDTVVSFFSGLSKNLYDKMSDLSKSVDGYRSFGSFYDDKKMKSDYDDYTSKIKDLEQKLNDYEDKWYAKFSKMETAMAKMQQNASAITGLLGGS